MKIDGKEIRAEILSNLAVIKMKGYRVRHAEKGDWLGEDHVFESKEQAVRFAWAIQERLDFNVKDKYGFIAKNPGLTRAQYCAIAFEEFERVKV